MKNKKLYRSKVDEKIAGVCGGIAEYFGIDATLVRLAWAILTVCGVGSGILIYIVCALVIPEKPMNIIDVE